MTIDVDLRLRSADPRQVAPPRVSVIVPTHDGAARLPILVAALSRQTASPALFEVLVVDDGSKDDTADVIRRSGIARLLQTPRNLGPAGACNLALEMARGEIIAFTDDDTVPARDWIERGIAAMSGANRVVGGRIELTYGDPPTVAELVDIGRGYLDQADMVQEGYAATANLWIRRDTLGRLGGFREIWASQTHDRDLVEHAVQAGVRLLYAPDVVVQHPARRSFRELARKEYRLAKGAAELRRRSIGGVSGERQVWTKPHIYRPWLNRASFARLEQRGLAPRGPRRAQVRLVQYVCLQLLQAAGSLVGSMGMVREDTGGRGGRACGEGTSALSARP